MHKLHKLNYSAGKRGHPALARRGSPPPASSVGRTHPDSPTLSCCSALAPSAALCSHHGRWRACRRSRTWPRNTDVDSYTTRWGQGDDLVWVPPRGRADDGICVGVASACRAMLPLPPRPRPTEHV
jgi:hypothetical protein